MKVREAPSWTDHCSLCGQPGTTVAIDAENLLLGGFPAMGLEPTYGEGTLSICSQCRGDLKEAL